MKGARTGLVDLEELSDEALEELQREFRRLQEREEVKEPAKKKKPRAS